MRFQRYKKLRCFLTIRMRKSALYFVNNAQDLINSYGTTWGNAKNKAFY